MKGLLNGIARKSVLTLSLLATQVAVWAEGTTASHDTSMSAGSALLIVGGVVAGIVVLSSVRKSVSRTANKA